MKDLNTSASNNNGKGILVLEKVETIETASPIATPSVSSPSPSDKIVTRKAGESASVVVLEPKEADTAREDLPSPTPSRKRPNTIALALLGMGAIALGAFGYHWWQYASTHEETDDATVAGHIHQVSARVPGNIAKVMVNDNQEVKDGQLLVQLDPADYKVKVTSAQAALESARRQASTAEANIAYAAKNSQAQKMQAEGNIDNAIAAISSAQAVVSEARAGVPSAQSKLAEVEANLQKLQADYNRYNALYQSGAVNRQQLDAAKAAYQVALAQKSDAEQGIRAANAKLAQAQEGVTQAQAQLRASQGGLQQASAVGLQTEVNRRQYEAAKAAIDQAQVTLQDAQLQLSYTNILATATGRIGRKTAEVGQRVQSGTPLLAIVDDRQWIVANFKETQLERMRPGEAVAIKLDAFPHRTFTGRVDSISPASGAQFALLPPDNATGNFTKIVQRVPVKVVFDPQSIKGYESAIAPGMSATVTVTVK